MEPLSPLERAVVRDIRRDEIRDIAIATSVLSTMANVGTYEIVDWPTSVKWAREMVPALRIIRAMDTRARKIWIDEIINGLRGKKMIDSTIEFTPDGLEQILYREFQIPKTDVSALDF